jgi:hypothetical protein
MNCIKLARKTFIFIIFFLLIPSILLAQYTLNFGLRANQDTATLPHSKSPVQFPHRKHQTPPKTVLSSVNEREWILSGGWMLADANVLVNSEKSIFNPEFSTTDWLNDNVQNSAYHIG